MIYQMGDILNGAFDLGKELEKEGILPRQEKAKRPSNKCNNYVNMMCAFDIETSRIDLPIPKGEKQNSHSFMYIWQFQVGREYTIIGRTWDEFKKLIGLLCIALYGISEKYKLADIPHLVCWVHNLSYEYEYISDNDIYPFRNSEVFFRDVRKPIYCTMFGCIEFRCSYIQTNMSLGALTKRYGVPVKLGGYDYDKIRYPWTELTDFELEYCTRDVSSLVAVMYKKMYMDGDNLQTIPLTSTGYVRRDVREALKPLYLQIRDILPTERAYRLLRDSFRGGNTHANKAFSGRVLDNVYSYDMASCYPAMQLTKMYPIKPWHFIDRVDLDKVLKFVGLGYAVVGRYVFTHLRLKNKKEAIPYLSLSRTESTGIRTDNGRLLSAEVCKTALTEIDLDIVIRQYEYTEIAVECAMVAQKGPLPEEYKEVIRRYYHNKTALKGVEGSTPEETRDIEYTYMKSKNLLNSIFGMSCQSALNSDIVYINGKYFVLDYETRKHLTDNKSKIREEIKRSGTQDDELEKLLSKAMDIDKTLLKAKFPYSWGVYTTAYARQALQEGIDLAGEKMVYCDTDSIKTLGPVPVDSINARRMNLAKKYRGVEEDRKGVKHYIGIFEYEKTYLKFVTTGAKRYAYIDHDCPRKEQCSTWPMCSMGITVSGVQSKLINEETGLAYAVEELGSLENFREDMIWYKAGGVLAVYNDQDDFDYTDPDTGRVVHIGKNVALCPSSYKMTFDKDYKELLTELQLYGEYIDERK